MIVTKSTSETLLRGALFVMTSLLNSVG